ncbi:hypothetical protein Syun_028853 [Stephania yunnanensis]|uniref:C2 domain-containing protein n=1 Tax=Stephania yunnanensis TaxID=152371 RepID=A0AAP0HGU2_9MAGN
MEHKPLDITVLSANDLKNVNFFTTMDVYVITIIGGDPRTTQRTAVAKGGGRNPTWNFPMRFTVVGEKPHQRRYSSNYNNHIMLTFEIRSKRFLGDRDIGEVHVPVEDLLVNAGDPKHINFVSYEVRRRSGISKGVLNFSYRFGEKVDVNEPVLAYPPPINTMYLPPGRDAGRPGGYPARMDRFGYQPTGPSYGHRLTRVTGLVGGALGGMLMGDMMSNNAAHDYGHGGAMGNGDGFDF